MRFGTWNVRSHYRSGSLTAAARELARYKLHVQEVRWDKGGTAEEGDYILFYGKGNENFNYTQRIVPAIKEVEFMGVIYRSERSLVYHSSECVCNK
jgi:hypothetical protein